ncbi:MAG: Bifunctional NAD(P)H-hydrate repair enzyme Nnr [Saprospiraceae bacterium]|nr:Bifunctional NAD(P)H-hydrate repair enzyme Nnr [Saprospiraceae bacterium]
MKIFNTAQIRAWDAYTIENEPIASIELMNRAAKTFTDWFIPLYPDTQRPVVVFAGTGNNGGDGLVVARLLHWQLYDVKVLVCDFSGQRSPDFQQQLGLLQKDLDVIFLHNYQELLQNRDFKNAVIIDALFGSGLSRPLEGEWTQVIDFLNQQPNEIVAIDLPSGLFANQCTPGESVIHATRTFSFETPKRAFFFPENAGRVGQWDYSSIGLHLDYYTQTETPFHYLTRNQATLLVHPRAKFSHKGTFGHALIIAGSYGKMGAATLAARACLKSGAGLVTVHAPRCGNVVLQTAVPEAMFSAGQRAKHWVEVPDIQSYSAIGTGCGIGQEPETARALEHLLQTLSSAPGAGLVLDADALNLLAQHPAWWRHVPRNTILTPHPKEFERLFGKTKDSFERNDLQRLKAQEHGVFIALKGAHTAIASPDGSCWFNSTGNPGMASGGTGDTLTGILTGLLAQGYSPRDAALLGVYLHGLAGDLAARELGQEALTAGDMIEFLGKAWLATGSLSH